VRTAYDRVARTYDLLEWPIEFGFFRFLRSALWARVSALPGAILELGAGTGRNFAHHPNRTVYAVDISPEMLRRARPRRRSLTRLGLLDAERLALADGCTDIVVGTFVFCSVPEPVHGLGELRRILRPAGRLFLLEHVRLEWQPASSLMRAVNPLVRRLTGVNIDRDTEENVRRGGFRVVTVRRYLGGLFKRIEAVPDLEGHVRAA
jgi:ubiquinone/menaquinone biosynthesis C-methylase UbiE